MLIFANSGIFPPGTDRALYRAPTGHRLGTDWASTELRCVRRKLNDELGPLSRLFCVASTCVRAATEIQQNMYVPPRCLQVLLVAFPRDDSCITCGLRESHVHMVVDTMAMSRSVPRGCQSAFYHHVCVHACAVQCRASLIRKLAYKRDALPFCAF